MPANILKSVASHILRGVPLQNTFSFYRAVGAPTGAAAHNLEDLLGIIDTIDLTSFQFHLGRGDFESWIRMLGDNTLADKLMSLKDKRLGGEQLGSELVKTVRARLEALGKATS